jgi:L-asparagine transporter-like permease
MMNDAGFYSISHIVNDRPSKQWMDSERIRLVMRGASYSEFLTFIAICLIFTILYGQVDLFYLSLWTTIGFMLLLVRLRNIKSYHQNKTTHNREEQIRLYDKQHIG